MFKAQKLLLFILFFLSSSVLAEIDADICNLSFNKKLGSLEKVMNMFTNEDEIAKAEYEKKKKNKEREIREKYPEITKVDIAHSMRFYHYGERYVDMLAKLYATKNIDDEDVKFIVDNDINKHFFAENDRADTTGTVILKRALRFGSPQLVKTLMTNGADPFIVSTIYCRNGEKVDDSRYPIIVEMLERSYVPAENKLALLEAYVEQGYDPHYLYKGYKSLLYFLSFSLDSLPNQDVQTYNKLIYKSFDYALANGFSLLDGKNYSYTPLRLFISSSITYPEYLDYIIKYIEQDYFADLEQKKGVEFRNEFIVNLADKHYPKGFNYSIRLLKDWNVDASDSIWQEVEAIEKKLLKEQEEKEDLLKKAKEL